MFEKILLIRNSHGGIQTLKNIQVSDKIFCDITILIDSAESAYDKTFQRNLKKNIEWDAGKPKDEIEDSEVIQLRSIAPYLNGVARVVYFKRDGNHIQLKSVMEGQMIHG